MHRFDERTERIADAENRITQLRTRIERLRDEGSDASQAQEMFQVLSRPLEGLDDRFPLRIGELDARHPFCVGNHL